MVHAGQAWVIRARFSCPTPSRAQPEQVLGRGQRLMHQKTGLLAGSNTGSAPGVLASPPPPSPGSWDTARTELEGEKGMALRRTQR